VYRTVADAALIEAAQRIAPLVRACRDEGERERRLPAQVLRVMHEARLFRMFIPKALGRGEPFPRPGLPFWKAPRAAVVKTGRIPQMLISGQDLLAKPSAAHGATEILMRARRDQMGVQDRLNDILQPRALPHDLVAACNLAAERLCCRVGDPNLPQNPLA
jgi:hypothetical protein